MTEVQELDPRTLSTIQRAAAAARAGALAQACAVGEQGLREGADGTAINAMLGVLRCQMGQFEAGISHLRLAHQARPDDLVIATHLAAALVQEGQFEDALKIATKERAEADSSLQLAQFRAFAAQSSEDFEAAVAAYQLIVDRQPDDWEAWNNLGNAYASLGDHEKSLEALKRAFELNSESPPLRVNYAGALVLLGRFDEAEEVLRESIEVDPADKPAALALAGTLKRQSKDEEGFDVLDNIIRYHPDDASLQLTYGVEARIAKRDDIAEAAFRKAIDLEPERPVPVMNLASLLDQLNREAEIPALIEEASRKGASEAALVYMKALDHRRANRFSDGAELLERMPDIGEFPGLELLRGQFFDRLGQYDEAFAAFERMNQIQRDDDFSQPEERASHYRQMLRTHYETITPEWAASWRHESSADSRRTPAFLVGFPRSGTTLLDTMLMGHTDVQVMEEQPLIRAAHLILDDLRAVPSQDDETIGRARDAYFKAAEEVAPVDSAKLLLDKNPLGMNSLSIVHRVFPDAKVILALRHPCDVLLSCFTTNFRLNSGMANFLSLDTAAELYDLSFSLLERARNLLPLSIHTVVYESLIAEPESELRKASDFLGLEWHEALLDHQSTARARGKITTASYAQVTEPIYTRSAGRWRNYRKHLEPIFPVVEPWVKKFGYSLD